jgi:hypothetical protein
MPLALLAPFDLDAPARFHGTQGVQHGRLIGANGIHDGAAARPYGTALFPVERLVQHDGYRICRRRHLLVGHHLGEEIEDALGEGDFWY